MSATPPCCMLTIIQQNILPVIYWSCLRFRSSGSQKINFTILVELSGFPSHRRCNHQISNVIIYINASIISSSLTITYRRKNSSACRFNYLQQPHAPRHCGSFIYCAQQLQALIAVIWLASPYPCNESLDLSRISGFIWLFSWPTNLFCSSKGLTIGFFQYYNQTLEKLCCWTSNIVVYHNKSLIAWK